MAIDTSMYSRNQDGFGESFAQGLSMRDLIDQRARQKKELAEQEAVKTAYKQGVVAGPDGSVSLDRKRTLSGLMQVNPKLALDEQQRLDSQDVQARNAKLERLQKEAGIVSQVLGNVQNEQDWQAGLGYLKQNGVDVGQYANMPYDPKLTQKLLTMTLTAKERLDNQMKEREFGLKQKELGLKEREIGSKRVKEAQSLASELRKERAGLPTTKATQEVVAAYGRVQEAAKNPSAAGDLALIFNYMKMLDPGSTVREGEFANAQNAGGIPDRVQSYYNSLLNGERLSPDQRADFLNKASGQYKSQMNVQRRVDDQYSTLAGKAGVSREDVIVDFEGRARSLEDMSDAELDRLYKEHGGT